MLEINLGKVESITVNKQYIEDDWYFIISNDKYTVVSFYFNEIDKNSFCLTIEESERRTGYIDIYNSNLVIVNDNPKNTTLSVENLVEAFRMFSVEVKEIIDNG